MGGVADTCNLQEVWPGLGGGSLAPIFSFLVSSRDSGVVSLTLRPTISVNSA